MYVGIDLGTSRVKMSVLTENLECVARTEKSLKQIYQSPEQISDALRPLLTSLVTETLAMTERSIGAVKAVGVSGGLPSGVLLDGTTGYARLAFTHLDPIPFKLPIHSGDMQSRIRKRRRRTRYWCQNVDILALKPLTLLPLHSYVIWLLSDCLTVDTISAFELGVSPRTGGQQQVRFNGENSYSYLLPAISPPAQVIGMTTGRVAFPASVPIVCGTYDTLTSALGAGVRSSGDVMLYYGSYFVVHQLNYEMATLLRADNITQPPYTALLVLPRAGLLIDNLLSLLQVSRTEAGHPLDHIALNCEARDRLPTFHIAPSTKIHTGMSPTASLGGLTLTTTVDDIATSLLASFGGAIRRENLLNVLRQAQVFAAGGGSRSQNWLRMTTEVTGAKQHCHPQRFGADGAALLAWFAVNKKLPSCDQGCELVAPR